jgi:WD40 repeat protein
MKINPDGLTLAIGDRNGNIRILDMQIFKQIALVEAHDSEVLSVDYGQSTGMGLCFDYLNSKNLFFE